MLKYWNALQCCVILKGQVKYAQFNMQFNFQLEDAQLDLPFTLINRCKISTWKSILPIQDIPRW